MWVRNFDSKICQLTNHKLTLNLTQSDGLQNPGRRSFFLWVRNDLTSTVFKCYFLPMKFAIVEAHLGPSKRAQEPRQKGTK